MAFLATNLSLQGFEVQFVLRINLEFERRDYSAERGFFQGVKESDELEGDLVKSIDVERSRELADGNFMMVARSCRERLAMAKGTTSGPGLNNRSSYHA